MIETAIKKYLKDKEITCEQAFEIANDFNVTANEIGRNLDLLNIKIIKCQLGLFGYKPEKKIIKPLIQVEDNIKVQIEKHLSNNKISCEDVWKIAFILQISKMTFSCACETLKIKIKPCQLGAF